MQANMVTFFILKSNHFGYNWCTWAGKFRISFSKFFFMSSCSFWWVLISDVRRFFHFLISICNSVMFFLTRAYSKFMNHKILLMFDESYSCWWLLGRLKIEEAHGLFINNFLKVIELIRNICSALFVVFQVCFKIISIVLHIWKLLKQYQNEIRLKVLNFQDFWKPEEFMANILFNGDASYHIVSLWHIKSQLLSFTTLWYSRLLGCKSKIHLRKGPRAPNILWQAPKHLPLHLKKGDHLEVKMRFQLFGLINPSFSEPLTSFHREISLR